MSSVALRVIYAPKVARCTPHDARCTPRKMNAVGAAISMIRAAISMIRTATTCNTTFTHRWFQYCTGVLHSRNDEPAATFLPLETAAEYIPEFDNMCSLPSISPVEHVARSVAYCARSQWYCGGELHRDYGPAVVGTYQGSRVKPLTGDAAVFWSKYHHGVQMASAANSFDAGEANSIKLSSRLLSCCPGGQQCGCVRIVARGPILRHACASTIAFARVYQTCAGFVIECRAALTTRMSSLTALRSRLTTPRLCALTDATSSAKWSLRTTGRLYMPPSKSCERCARVYRTCVFCVVGRLVALFAARLLLACCSLATRDRLQNEPSPTLYRLCCAPPRRALFRSPTGSSIFAPARCTARTTSRPLYFSRTRKCA